MEITKKNIYKLMKSIGMNTALQGFNYACELIMRIDETYQTTGKTNIMLSQEYQRMADEDGKDPSVYERLIRYFIENGFNRIKPRDIEKIFVFNMWNSGYPPVKEFIYGVYNYMVYEGEDS